MVLVVADKRYYTVPPRIDTNDWQQISKNEFNRQTILLFFQSRKGTRPLLPGWGFDFFRDEPYDAESLRSLMILDMATWFPDVEVLELTVEMVDIGYFVAELQVESYDTEKITINIT